MPKPVPRVSIDSLVQRVEASSSTLGEKATALSTTIEEVNDRLQSMPGKLAVYVEDDNGVRLSFQKWSGDWGLFLVDSNSEEDYNGGRERIPSELTGVSIARKARAFRLLPQLLRDIDAVQKDQIAEIDLAFESLRDLEGN